jgi:predicted transglutaminase-like cysteine proteinase
MLGRCILALVAALVLTPAAASPSLIAVKEAPPVAAWAAFCARQPAECRPAGGPDQVAPTADLLELVDAVNAYVNRTISPVTDVAQHGVVDLWQYPAGGRGDCEDYQLLKRRYLVEAGVPRRALPMTVVIDELGQGHAVLTVRTDKGDLILDNKTFLVKRWDETDYTFVKREADTATGWGFVEHRSEKAVVAAAQE